MFLKESRMFYKNKTKSKTKTHDHRHNAAPAQVLQSCPTLCNPMDCSPAGFSGHGILQARVLERVAVPSSRGSSQSRDQTWVSCIAGRFFTTELPEKPQTHNRDGINKRWNCLVSSFQAPFQIWVFAIPLTTQGQAGRYLSFLVQQRTTACKRAVCAMVSHFRFFPEVRQAWVWILTPGF